MPAHPLLPHLIRSAAPAADLVPDRALVADFAATNSGLAFELLVRRHGAAVWAVCRRHLNNAHDAEDAFQATFLVLARRAERVRGCGSVGGWLLGVAYRVALKARRTAARRKRVEAVVSPTHEPSALPVHPNSDAVAAVHAELERLPDRYRLPLLLCELEGVSRKDAAAQLGWPEGTLSGRLSRGRSLLARRLAGRGFAAALVVVATTSAPAYATVAAAVTSSTSPAAPEAVAALALGVMRAMTRTFVVKVGAGVLAAAVLLGGGLVGLRFDPQAQAAPVPKEEKVKPEDVTDSHAQLLAQAAVQRELKLGAELRVKLIDGFDKLDEEWQKEANKVLPVLPALPGGAPGGPDGGVVGGPGAGDYDAGWKKHQKAVRELASANLSRAEFKRLQQVEVQTLGLYALKLKRVADELKLTDDQKKEVDAAAQAVNGGGPAVDLPAFPGGGGVAPGFPGQNGGAVQQPDDALAGIVKGFSDAQAKAWKELQGEKVGFDKQRVMGNCPALFETMYGGGAGGDGSTTPGTTTPAFPPQVAPGFPGGGVPVPLPAPAPNPPK